MQIRSMALRTMLLCLLAAGCTQWRPQPLAPQQLVRELHPDRIRVTLADSSVLKLEHPVTSGDSIVGMVHGARTAIAADRIARAQVPEHGDGGLPDLLSLTAGVRSGERRSR